MPFAIMLVAYRASRYFQGAVELITDAAGDNSASFYLWIHFVSGGIRLEPDGVNLGANSLHLQSLIRQGYEYDLSPSAGITMWSFVSCPHQQIIRHTSRRTHRAMTFALPIQG